jgi:hypothetical protein
MAKRTARRRFVYNPIRDQRQMAEAILERVSVYSKAHAYGFRDDYGKINLQWFYRTITQMAIQEYREDPDAFMQGLAAYLNSPPAPDIPF